MSPLWTALYRDASPQPVAWASLPRGMWSHVYLETGYAINNKVVMMASVYGAAGWARRRLSQAASAQGACLPFPDGSHTPNDKSQTPHTQANGSARARIAAAARCQRGLHRTHNTLLISNAPLDCSLGYPSPDPTMTPMRRSGVRACAQDF